MKFNELYNRVIVAEEDSNLDPQEVADPANFDDVEPVPTDVAVSTGSSSMSSPENMKLSASETEVLKKYRDQIEEFRSFLTTPEDSLNVFVNKIDQDNTPFKGMSQRIKSNISQAAKSLGDITVEIDMLVGVTKNAAAAQIAQQQ